MGSQVSSPCLWGACKLQGVVDGLDGALVVIRLEGLLRGKGPEVNVGLNGACGDGGGELELLERCGGVGLWYGQRDCQGDAGGCTREEW